MPDTVWIHKKKYTTLEDHMSRPIGVFFVRIKTMQITVQGMKME